MFITGWQVPDPAPARRPLPRPGLRGAAPPRPGQPGRRRVMTIVYQNLRTTRMCSPVLVHTSSPMPSNCTPRSVSFSAN